FCLTVVQKNVIDGVALDNRCSWRLRRTRLGLSTHKEGQTMKTKYTVALSMIAGAAIGALAIQGLHAQASKSRVFFITESDIVDQGSLGAYNAVIRPAVKAAGGDLVVSEQTTAVRGEGYRGGGCSKGPGVEKVKAWLDSPERKALAPKRNRAINFPRQYIVEGQ